MFDFVQLQGFNDALKFNYVFEKKKTFLNTNPFLALIGVVVMV